jgi:hypothetical protein
MVMAVLSLLLLREMGGSGHSQHRIRQRSCANVARKL